MAEVIGRVTDYTGTPLDGAQPYAYIRATGAGAEGATVYVTKRIPITLNSAGEFVGLDLKPNVGVRPPMTYRFIAGWQDPTEPGGAGRNVIDAPFDVPTEGGKIGDLINASAKPGNIAYGYGPPPEWVRNVVYLDISGFKPRLYLPKNGSVS